jgi:hypothetical protein
MAKLENNQRHIIRYAALLKAPNTEHAVKLHVPTGFLLTLAMLTACKQESAEQNVAVKESNSEISISSTMAKAIEEARKEIATSNMSLGDSIGKEKAEITPQGDLLIANKPVTITPEHRQLLIKHRETLVMIAIEGMGIGMQGAELAKTAVGESIKSIFSGDKNQVEKAVEAKAKKIEVSAKALCEQLPLLFESQQKLAEALPEFKPYATMTIDDVKDCKDGIKKH